MIPGHRHLEIGQPSKPRASGDDPVQTGTDVTKKE